MEKKNPLFIKNSRTKCNKATENDPRNVIFFSHQERCYWPENWIFQAFFSISESVITADKQKHIFFVCGYKEICSPHVQRSSLTEIW